MGIAVCLDAEPHPAPTKGDDAVVKWFGGSGQELLEVLSPIGGLLIFSFDCLALFWGHDLSSRGLVAYVASQVVPVADQLLQLACMVFVECV